MNIKPVETNYNNKFSIKPLNNCGHTSCCAFGKALKVDTFVKKSVQQLQYKISAQDQIMGNCGFVIPDFVFILKDKIDGKKLLKATTEALELHPLYKTKLAKDKKGLYVWETNNAKPIIKEHGWQDKITYGTQENNYFPWLITYNGKKIVMTASHMLSDGTGVFNFMKSVLRLYFEENGVKFSDAKKWDVTINSAKGTLEDAYLKYAQKSKPKLESPSSAILIPKDKQVATPDDTKTYRFILDKKDLKQMYQHSETSISSVLSYFLAKAMEKSLGKSKGHIDIPLPVNCRNFFSSQTDRNFIAIAPLSYDIKKMGYLSKQQVEKIFRKQLDKAIQKDNMQATFDGVKALTEDIERNPDILKVIKAGTKNNEANKKATICYTHITRTNFPQELENLIENIEMYSAIPANGASVCAFTCTFKDKVAITIRHLLKDNAFVKNLEKLFKETKLKYELREVQPRENVCFKYI